jgi:hypothetical protein
MTTTQFNKIINKMESFDLICITRNAFMSSVSCVAQKIYTNNNEWAHVGIVIKNDVLPDIKNKIYIWHSLPSAGGVNLVDLKKYIDLQKLKIIKIGLCKLKNNPLHRKINDTDESYNKRIKKIKKKINEFYNLTKNSKFNYFVIYLGLPFLKNNFHDEQQIKIQKSYFCSNFVTSIYQTIDVIDKSENPDFFFPISVIKYKRNLKPILDDPILFEI